ncbi:MAG: hypothetical protein HOH01_01955, partial [Candidatus Jacksonbacteria bacterium]|nr:hypothetical protein [Candidatus Jacksonbacteria bacterium]
TDGHGDLTCYNFAVLMTHKDKKLVDDVPYRNGFTDIVSDSFKLTEAGEAALSEAVLREAALREAALKDTSTTKVTGAKKRRGFYSRYVRRLMEDGERARLLKA